MLDEIGQPINGCAMKTKLLVNLFIVKHFQRVYPVSNYSSSSQNTPVSHVRDRGHVYSGCQWIVT
jgi:hypothetical protein